MSVSKKRIFFFNFAESLSENVIRKTNWINVMNSIILCMRLTINLLWYKSRTNQYLLPRIIRKMKGYFYKLTIFFETGNNYIKKNDMRSAEKAISNNHKIYYSKHRPVRTKCKEEIINLLLIGTVLFYFRQTLPRIMFLDTLYIMSQITFVIWNLFSNDTWQIRDRAIKTVC